MKEGEEERSGGPVGFIFSTTCRLGVDLLVFPVVLRVMLGVEHLKRNAHFRFPTDAMVQNSQYQWRGIMI